MNFNSKIIMFEIRRLIFEHVGQVLISIKVGFVHHI